MDIQQLWLEGRCPCLSGIIRGTGAFTPVTVEMSDPWDHQTYKLNVGGNESDITVPDEVKPESCLSLSEFYETTDYRRFLRVGCGETSWEGEGFVAFSDPNSNELRWIAVLPNTGEFEVCLIYESFVAARSSYNVWWIFPVDSPENAMVERSSPLFEQ